MKKKLPYRENAHISPSKLTDYLLSETHSVGRSKAKFFRSVGFMENNLEALKSGLLSIAHTGDILDSEVSPYGMKFVVDGVLRTPDGGAVGIRTVWIIEKDQTVPRFVTAYPA